MRTILPGRFILEPGRFTDYRSLERFHYAARKPATIAGIWRAVYLHRDEENSLRRCLAGVIVLSYPCNSLRMREFALNLPHERNANLAFVNAHLRTISRVIVHPQFRSLGLSRMLIRCACSHCPTRFVEALAKMGRIHPLFEQAGMKRFDPEQPDKPVYYLYDKQNASHRRGQQS